MVLRSVERKIEALFEGIFGRAFRTNVQPVELARKLAKEMDDHRTVSVSRVLMETDSDLDVGEFGIATRMVQPDRQRGAGEPPSDVEPGATMIYKPKQPQPTQAVTPEELGVEPEVVTLSWNGTRHEVTQRRVVIGRSRDCDIQLADSNVSRRHAELRQEGASFWIVDLGSTNGM